MLRISKVFLLFSVTNRIAFSSQLHRQCQCQPTVTTPCNDSVAASHWWFLKDQERRYMAFDHKVPNEDMGESTANLSHTKSLGPGYPGTNVKKTEVPAGLVSWDAECKEYAPVEYTAPSVKAKPEWADPDDCEAAFKEIKFNTMDGKTNRTTYTGKNYTISDGKPRNPVGRTGMIGRGLLGKWGPNHAADPIVTRWHRDSKGEKVSIDNKFVLEFVSISRRDTGEWAIPGGMVDSGEHVSLTLKREFGEEALNSLEEVGKEETKKLIDELFSKGEVIYQGYVDDPRNTDNSWMETCAYNFHDDDGSTVGKIPLSAGDDATAVRWLPINKKLSLYASHVDFIEKVCSNHKAYFVK